MVHVALGVFLFFDTDECVLQVKRQETDENYDGDDDDVDYDAKY